MERRDFLRYSMAAGGLMALTAANARSQESSLSPPTKEGMKYATLGRTGINLSILGVGCAPLGQTYSSQQAADEVLQRAVELGVTYIDTAPNYAKAEERMGHVMPEVRDKIFLATNHKPKINCNDPAIWRRVKLIPFTVRIHEEEQVQDLDKQLEAELPGILNWGLSGGLDWQRKGLQTPEEVENATKEYRNEMDTVNEFLEECCTLSKNVKVNPTDLYTAYKKHCELNGEAYLSMKDFGLSLNAKGYDVKSSNGRNWRIGIGLPCNELASGSSY